MATRSLNPRVLDPSKRRIVRLQAESVREGGFFLAGGTGLGVRLGHRLSDDLDWFTPSAFDANDLMARLAALPRSRACSARMAITSSPR